MKSSLLSSTFLACSVFASLTLPLALMGSKSVQVKVQQENVFSGTVKDAALPYLTLASLISVGAGAASLSVAGWKHSHRKSTQIREQLSAIQQELRDKEIQIENLQLSEVHLKKSGLDQFLESLPIQEPAYVTAPVMQAHIQPEVEPQIVTPASPHPVTYGIMPEAKEAVAASHSESVPSRLQVVSDSSVSGVINQFSELQGQLKYMAEQIETLQTVFKDKPAPVVESHAAPVLPSTSVPIRSAGVDSSTLAIEHLHRRLQQLESHWMREQVAS